MVRKKQPAFRPTYVREWRKHRGLSQERLADRVNVTQETISRLENGKHPYSQPLLEALAEALRCEPADLLVRDPSREDYLWSIWDQIPPTQRPQAVKILKTFGKTGTEG